VSAVTDAQPIVFDRHDIERKLRDFSRYWREQIDEWRTTGASHTEKSFAQQFWSDFLKCFGVIPERISLFERDARRATTGNTGFYRPVLVQRRHRRGEESGR
jgi:hypothetical protein